MAEQLTYLIIGNGIAGVTAAEILRAENSAATIAVIADDPFPVYYRPALKDYLAGRVREEKLWARPTSFYQDHNIYFLPDRVTRIDVGQHAVLLQSKRQVRYQRLLLANGARATRLNCRGMNLNGVTTLRTIADYQAVLKRLKVVRHVVVSGSGTLALETIETLRHRGFEVTHLLRRRTLWSEVLDATASDLVLQQETRDGVDVRLEDEISEITGTSGEVDGVVTTKGERIPCEMVVVAIGVEPMIDFIKASGIACGRGVKVDPMMRTNAPDIYAAGDVLETMDTMTGRTRVIGQWYPAVQQARAAAYSMLDQLGTDRSFRASTFYNATFLYGLDFASVGLTNAQGYQEILATPKPRTYRKVLLKEGIAVGMLSLGDRKQALAFKRAIDHRVNLLPVAARLFADDFKLNDWLDSRKVPPPLLAVSRAGSTVSPPEVYPKANTEKIAAQKVTDEAAAVKQQEPAPTQAWLVMAAQPGTNLRLSETLLSQTNTITVGREPGVHLLIDEGSVSRRHAEIKYANGQYILRDLGSTNGTFINEVRLKPTNPQALKPNDQIRFGKVVKFVFLLRTVSNAQAKQPAVTSVSMAGITKLHEMQASEDRTPQGQPMLNPDGSLLLSGATNAIPAALVEAFQKYPALIVLTGNPSKEGNRPPLVYLLKQKKHIMIGRDKGNDIELADVVVSRRHAEIFLGPEGFYIRDLGSSNGIRVNQAKIENLYLLSHCDRIAMGSSMIYFLDLRSGLKTTEQLQSPSAKLEGRAQTEQLRPISGQIEQPSAALQRIAVCQRCGVANSRVARFCASCSAPLRSS